ncbi:MAG: glycine betaine ABC transporter substrate-binding protein [Candidatus Sulfobium sp.]
MVRPKRASRIIVLLCMVFCFFIVGACEKKAEKGKTGTIAIGAKHFTEQEILGEMMAQLIEARTDIKVVRKLNLGGTMVCFDALRTGDIDLYPEYTGTGLVNILKKKTERDPDRAYRTVKSLFKKRYDLVWLRPFGFNNTYTLTMRKKQAESLLIEKISDLAPYRNDLQPGFDAEFLERPDGYRGLTKYYGFSFSKTPRQMDPGLMYKALAEGAVDVIDGFATDGRIQAYGLVTLRDDKHFFPPYYAAPLIRAETLKEYPEAGKVLGALSGAISDETMRTLNYKVDGEGERPADVAQEFLRARGLIGTGK